MGGGVMDVSLVITIHDRIELYDLMKFYESKNVTPVVTMLGRGTATEKQDREAASSSGPGGHAESSDRGSHLRKRDP